MPPVSPEAFAGSLRGLSAPELAEFVADLWGARGWDTAVEGRTVVVSDGAVTRRLLIRPRGPLARLLPRRLPRRGARVSAGPNGEAGEHDAVVVRSLEARAPDGTGAIDAAELRLMALYAVDPETRAQLFDRHLGRPPTADAGPGGTAVRSVPVPVLASVILLVATAAIGAVSLGGGDGLPSSATPGPGTGTDTPTPTTDAADVHTATGTGPAGGAHGPEVSDAAPYPLGIRSDGVQSVDHLVVSHVVGLAPRSHRWQVSYREVVDGRTRGRVNETVTVENATVYRSVVERSGSVEFSPAVVSAVSTYADGTARYERLHEGGTTRYRRLVPGMAADDGPPFADHPRHVIEWYLSVRESRLVGTTVRDGTRYYRLAGEGDAWPGTTDVRVTATVDERGVVRQLRRTHRPPDADARVVVTFRVSGIGNTTVSPPPWLGAARRATANETSG